MTDRKDKKAIKEPNFFIVGAAKCGTTSLAKYLGQHPEICMSPVKEPFYYMSDSTFGYDEYLTLFKDAGDAKAIGEASTSYLFDEQSPVLIKKCHPDARIIIILRNPVSMVFSFWWFNLRDGSESKSFEEAISLEEQARRRTESFKNSCAGWWGNFLYIERALYYKQVKRYFDVFGKDRVKVYIFESFIKNPEEACKDIFSFLGVNPNFIPNCKKVMNEGGVARFEFLTQIHNRRYPFLKSLFPKQIKVKIRKALRVINTKKGEKVQLSLTEANRLAGFFRTDIEKLEDLLGYKLSEWRHAEP